MKDGRFAQPSVPTLPGTPGTIVRKGPAVRPGRLGTLRFSEVAGWEGGWTRVERSEKEGEDREISSAVGGSP